MIDPRDPALNYVVVNGIRSPGIARFSNVNAPQIYDVIPLYGMGGARTIYRGPGIAKPVLTLWFWLPEHFVAWSAWQLLIKPPTPLKPLVVAMGHPILAEAGLSAIAVEDIVQPERSETGKWVARIQLSQWRPPEKALVKPRGAIPAVSKGAPIAPQTEADKQLVIRQAQLEAAVLRGNR